MEMFLLFASYLVLVNIVTLVDSSGVSAPSNSQWHKVTIDQWDSLNAQVGGRLHLQLPFAAECFTKVNERPNVVDIDSCTAIQANYTDRCEFGSTLHFQQLTLVSHSFPRRAAWSIYGYGVGDMPNKQR